MKATSDTLTIRPEVTDVKGDRLEPEEVLAERKLGVEIPVSLGNGPLGGEQVATLRNGGISTNLTALEATEIFGKRCSRCAFWDRTGWQATRRRWDDPSNAEGWTTLNRIRSFLLDLGPDQSPGLVSGAEIHDVERALSNDVAICQALTDASREVTLTHAIGCCPTALEDGTPFADTFRPVAGGETAREVDAVYDTILRRAQGR